MAIVKIYNALSWQWAAGLAAFSLLDCANCLRLGHDDWWYPAAAAFLFTLKVK